MSEFVQIYFNFPTNAYLLVVISLFCWMLFILLNVVYFVHMRTIPWQDHSILAKLSTNFCYSNWSFILRHAFLKFYVQFCQIFLRIVLLMIHEHLEVWNFWRRFLSFGLFHMVNRKAALTIPAPKFVYFMLRFDWGEKFVSLGFCKNWFSRARKCCSVLCN